MTTLRLWGERDRDRIGQLIDAAQNRLTGISP